jgi:tellurite resistance protein TehA-like permease
MRFPGIYAIGVFFFLLNIVLFIFNIIAIIARFAFYPSTFRASFLHPTESLFVPAATISFGTILLNITEYGVGHQTGDWLERTMIVLYWMYCGIAVALSSTVYLILWSTQTFTISQMTPVWIFPAYPLLIVGPHAGQLAKKVPAEDALQIIVGGYVLQGIGFMVSLMIYSAFVYRLMTQKLPKENVRPGMFVSVGPSGFTISGLITMGQTLPSVVSPNFMGEGMGVLVGQVSMIVANWVGLWLWGLAFWFLLISVGAHFSSAWKGKIHFAMTWYAYDNLSVIILTEIGSHSSSQTRHSRQQHSQWTLP